MANRKRKRRPWAGSDYELRHWKQAVESYHNWLNLYHKVSNNEVKQRCKERMEAIQAEFPNHYME